MKTALITGSGGLIGSEAVKYFSDANFSIIGIDNNMREYFFGAEASTDWNVHKLQQQINSYNHQNIDIRNRSAVENLFRENNIDLVIHCAAQPSHDWAAREPFTDFGINAYGTLIMLENFRKYSPDGVFIFTSTNKVYGDTPNRLPLIEKETRFEIDPAHPYVNGIDESMSIDQSKHSLFGASKLAADILVQEYGRYFGLKTACFRGGCLTGPAHSPAELHGFLAYLVKCIATGTKYSIFGYKGKQVRDNIHSNDLVRAFHQFFKNPKIGEVYNIGGSRFSNISLLEAITAIETIFDKKANFEYVDSPRLGDHIWYISDVSKFRDHYPGWDFQYDSDMIIRELCEVYLNNA